MIVRTEGSLQLVDGHLQVGGWDVVFEDGETFASFMRYATAEAAFRGLPVDASDPGWFDIS